MVNQDSKTGKKNIDGDNNKKEEFKKKAPEYTNDGVAVWVNKDKNGKNYLSIKIVGHNTITALLNTPKDK